MFENQQEGIKYAVRLRNRGPRTLNGDGGVAKVKGPDGTTFTFSACSLSSNGTNHNRGQIPQVLYYRYVMIRHSFCTSTECVPSVFATSSNVKVTVRPNVCHGQGH